ncbi:prepilin-type N-terminal cleavage/methylation domain-containing protein [Corallincola holothuriorum]|uniref:Prepilin-type N-terminal cleavage/methylation domain-containing protein n=1 Tax=Corallincola holothuriorum TaxID=2282215 RepID=A0A368NI95_9GAMM|nr:prepilin-type N-terminal cleavage/methylation domain-containing protein [Corallincola holothuriorum]RCU49830.1 prepilin-type N-terminal cleavage/methylation domain-containing protein [Corallincola holothuriorum]
MRKQQGFTLIELVVVIIILGILAVTAAPKFIDLQGDARESTMQGMKAALEGASTLTYSKAAIGGIEKKAAACLALSGTAADPDTCTDATATEVNVVYGYPKAATADLQKVLETVFGDGSGGEEWDIDLTLTADAVITLSGTDGTNTPADKCQVEYNEANDANSRPVIVTETAGC